MSIHKDQRKRLEDLPELMKGKIPPLRFEGVAEIIRGKIPTHCYQCKSDAGFYVDEVDPKNDEEAAVYRCELCSGIELVKRG